MVVKTSKWLDGTQIKKFSNVLYNTFVSSQLRFFSFSFSGHRERGCQKSAVEGLLYAFKFTLGNFNDLFMRKVQNEKNLR